MKCETYNIDISAHETPEILAFKQKYTETQIWPFAITVTVFRESAHTEHQL